MWKGISIAVVVVAGIAFALLQNRAVAPLGPGSLPPAQPSYDRLNKPTLDHVGKPALNWNIPAQYWMNTGGKAISLGDLRGKVTLIEFFRIKCPHCEAAAPEMIAIHNALKSRGLNMVAIQSPGNEAEEKDWNHVQATLRQWRIPYPVAFDQGTKEFKKNGFVYYPTVIVLDKQGIVRFAQSGYDDGGVKLQRLLDALYKQLGLTPTTVPLQLAVGAKP